MFTLITGPMKSGKSLELIAQVSPYEFSTQKVVYAQSIRNTRESVIKSRAGVSADNIRRVESLTELGSNFDVLGIDEAHMFSKFDISYVEKIIKKGKTVIISGLDIDYRGNLTPLFNELYALKPDIIILKTAVCDKCKQYKAQFTQIVTDKGSAVTFGLPSVVPDDGTYYYETRCRDCFVKPKTRDLNYEKSL